MSGNLLILFELSLVFLVVFGWGFNELRQLRKYREKSRKHSEGKSGSD
ncbi:MAG: hypothetical protein AB8B64_09800 [Granulosicoccus sp.]